MPKQTAKDKKKINVTLGQWVEQLLSRDPNPVAAYNTIKRSVCNGDARFKRCNSVMFIERSDSSARTANLCQ